MIMLRFLAVLTMLIVLFNSGDGTSLRCSGMDVGTITGVVYPTLFASVLSKNDELTACTCEERYMNNGQAIQTFMGVYGALLPGDCAALRFFAKRAADKLKADRESGGERPHLIYVESGSYLGLSAHIVTATALGEGVPVLAYAHDLFDTSTTDLWDHASADKTNLQHFYSNVRRNGFEHNIIPVIGQSFETMSLHEDASVDLVFIDGDHTYEGALADIREGWRILRPGGFLLGHDTVPVDQHIYHGGMGWNGVEFALRTFTAEMGLTRPGAGEDGMCANAWSIVSGTGYMFLIMKGG